MILFMVLHWFVSAFALVVTAYLVPGFEIRGFGSALLAAIVIGLVNALLWPLLIFLTLPINLITFGLFTFVVNAALLRLCAALLAGFTIRTWAAAILGAVVLALVGMLLHYLLV